METSINFNRVASVDSTGPLGNGPTGGSEGGQINRDPNLAGYQFFTQGMDAGNWGDGLPQFLSKLTEGRKEQMRQQAKWRGYVAARGGKTMQEVQEESPWYSRVFGPTDYELGARLYTTRRNLSDYGNTLIEQMPELRKLSPDEFASKLNDDAQNFMTGDVMTDVVVQNEMMDRTAQVIDLHAKSRIAWQQGQLLNLQVQGVASESTTYNNLVKSTNALGSTTPNDPAQAEKVQIARLRVMEGMKPHMYQPDESVQGMVDASVRGVLDRGEFFTYRDVFERTGALDAAGAEKAQELRRYAEDRMRTYKNKWQADPGVYEQVAELQYAVEAGLGGLPVVERALAINRRWEAETGATIPFYNAEEIGNFGGRGVNAYVRRRESDAREATRLSERQEDKAERAAIRQQEKEDKQRAEAEDTAEIAASVARGGYGRTLMYSDNKGKVDRVAAATYEEAYRSNPSLAAGMLVQNWSIDGGKVIGPVRDELQDGFKRAIGEQVNDGFMESYRHWQRVNATPGYKIANGKVERTDVAAGQMTAMQYYGPELHSRLVEFQKLERSNVPIDVAYRMTFGEHARERRGDLRGIDSEQTKRNITELKAAVADHSSGVLGRLFGGYSLHPSTQALIAEQGAYYFENLNDPSLLPDDRARQAVRAVFANGMERKGRWAWENASNQASVASHFGADKDELFDEVVDTLVEDAIKGSGGDLDGSVRVVRGNDVDGRPSLHVVSFGQNGFTDAVIRADDMRKAYDDKRKRQVTPLVIDPALRARLDTEALYYAK